MARCRGRLATRLPAPAVGHPEPQVPQAGADGSRGAAQDRGRLLRANPFLDELPEPLILRRGEGHTVPCHQAELVPAVTNALARPSERIGDRIVHPAHAEHPLELPVLVGRPRIGPRLGQPLPGPAGGHLATPAP